MRTTLLILTVAVLALFQAGCATSFRAGGRNGGVDAGGTVGRSSPPIVIQEDNGTPPPPVTR